MGKVRAAPIVAFHKVIFPSTTFPSSYFLRVKRVTAYFNENDEQGIPWIRGTRISRL